MLAHGIGSRADLPLPLWLFAWCAGFAVLISFVALTILWPKPRLARVAAGRHLPGAARSVAPALVAVLRAAGLFLFGVVLVAALWGVDNSAANIAPVAVYVVFWVGLQLACALLGDVWRALNPFDTLALIVFGGRLPERTSRRDPGQWTAAVMIASFAWLELAYHEPSSPRALGVWLSAYTVAALAGAALWGRGWLRTGEGFAGLFGLLGRIGPFERDPETRKLSIRPPLSGLAALEPLRGTTALVVVTLGSTTFDGVTRLDVWTRDLVAGRRGWEATAVATIGLLFVIALVALLWLGATRLSGRITGDDPGEVADAYAGSLVPIVLAYSIAHYFSLLMFEAQNVIALASDPFGRGWDLFGTISNSIDYSVVSPNTIAWVQAVSIVVGHVSGVVVAHDRAVERHPPRLAGRSQWPLVGAMVLYTVGGLYLLLEA